MTCSTNLPHADRKRPLLELIKYLCRKISLNLEETSHSLFGITYLYSICFQLVQLTTHRFFKFRLWENSLIPPTLVLLHSQGWTIIPKTLQRNSLPKNQLRKIQ